MRAGIAPLPAAPPVLMESRPDGSVLLALLSLVFRVCVWVCVCVDVCVVCATCTRGSQVKQAL